MIRRRADDGSASGASPGREAAQLRAALRERNLHRSWHRIPIYLVIGPAGMGKSTLLQRSGLNLDGPVELASSNWWIGEDALFAETAQDPGRDGSHPVLPLLRLLRPDTPVCGVISVVSPADLTLADIGERTDMSAAQVRLLRELEAQVGYAPPLYFVLSKLDLTPGFAEFFDRLEPAEREQPWGFTLPVALGQPAAAPADRGLPPTQAEPAVARGSAQGSAQGAAQGRNARRQAPARTARTDAALKLSNGSVLRPISGPAAGRDADAPSLPAVDGASRPQTVAAAYRDSFRRLLDSLRARVTQWISQENDVAQCDHIVGFGAQIAALEVVLRPLVEPLMPSDKRRWQGAFFRGVYLTSTQQDALSIDALLPEMAKRFALQRTGSSPPDLGRDDETLSYFVEGMFRGVILPEAGLVQRNNLRARRRGLKGWLAVAAVLIGCAALGIATALSYREGVARIAAVDEAVGSTGSTLAAADPARLPGLLAGLDAVAAMQPAEAPTPSLLTVSLDRTAAALIAATGRRLYNRGLYNSLAPHLDALLARDLVRTDASGEALRLAIAAADRGDGTDAYERWLQGVGNGMLPADAQAALLRNAAQAFRIGAVPDVAPPYPAFARKVLAIRNEAR